MISKQFVLTSKKALKKEQFRPENAGNGICETLNFKIFPPGTMPSDPFTTLAAMPLVGQANVCPPPKNFLARTPMDGSTFASDTIPYWDRFRLLPRGKIKMDLLYALLSVCSIVVRVEFSCARLSSHKAVTDFDKSLHIVDACDYL